MYLPESSRDAEIVECVCNAVGEAAYNEQRNTEQQRQILFLASEQYC